jgi:hypothetical protein
MIVDMAGNFSSMQDLHEHFQDNVKYSCSVGATHQANQKDFNVGDMSSFPGAKPIFFFAPTQAQKRTVEWGGGELQKRIGLSLQSFQKYSAEWIEIDRHQDNKSIENIFKAIIKGEISPNKGNICSIN